MTRFIRFFGAAWNSIHPIIAAWCLVFITLCNSTVCAERELAQSDDQVIGRLLSLKGKPTKIRELERMALELKHEDKRHFIAAGLEIYNFDHAEIEAICHGIQGNRRETRSHPELAGILAWSCVSNHKASIGMAIIDQLDDGSASGLTEVDILTIKALHAIRSSRPLDAKDHLKNAKTAFKRAVPDADYVTLHSRLLQNRLRTLDGMLKEQKKAVDETAHTAWLKADQSGKLEAYQEVRDQYPDTFYAKAAALMIARSHLEAGHADDCIDLLEQSGCLSGVVGVPARILMGDAMLIGGESIHDVSKVYDSALSALSLNINHIEEDRELVTPKEPLHYLNSRGFPEWRQRPAGSIPSAELGQLGEYYRYMVIVRRSALLYSDGKSSTASDLARSLVMFDPVDKTMVENKEGAGGIVLSETWRTRNFLFSMDCFEGAPGRVEPLLMMAVAFQRVYHWEESKWWVQTALNDKSLRKGLPRDAANALLACLYEAQNNPTKALEICRQIESGSGGRVSHPWFIARMVEKDIHLNARPTRYEEAIAVMQSVVDEAPRNSMYAKRAMLFQSTIAKGVDPALAKKYYIKLQSIYPDYHRDVVKSEILSLN